jgi:hypothetical protein
MTTPSGSNDMNDCWTTETGATERTDLVGNKRAYFLLWRLPWVAVVVSLLVKDPSLKAVIWTIAFAQMGVACIANATGCRRMHCFFTGPWYLLAAVASFLRGSGRLSIPWPVLGGLTWLGVCALWWLPERLWGKYAGRSSRGISAIDQFTDRARRVFERAQEEAESLNHHYIGTEHLFLGLLREGDGVAATLLNEHGITLDRGRSTVEGLIGRGRSEHVACEPLGLTPRSKKVIELAVDEARRLKHNYVGTEHLLLGLVREGEGVAIAALKLLRGPTDLPVMRQRIAFLLSPS